jgi:hypothetical protein
MTPHKHISSSKVILVGLIRNGASVIESEIEKISKAFRNFSHFKWLVVESDSSDDTLKTLERLKSSKGISFVSLATLRLKYPKRTARLSHCRNVYLEIIFSNEAYKDFDYVAVVDLDGVNQLLTDKAVESCWGLNVEWDACFANQKSRYYDIWALRHDLWCPNDCLLEKSFFDLYGANSAISLFSSVPRRMINIPEDANPILVKSAFGGLGIYKIDCFRDVKYAGLHEDGNECSEHVNAHHEMCQNGAKLYINPKLINGSTNEHSNRFKWFSKLLIYLVLPNALINKLKQIRAN